jgi:hypothetical protein
MSESHELTEIDHTLRKTAAALHDAGVPFALGGSLACWARGGPRVRNDVDVMVAPDDAEAAIAALRAVGMQPERPPETWLVKAWDGDVCVDVIFAPLGVRIDHDTIAAADQLDVLAIRMPVLSVEEVLVSRLLAIDEHRVEFTSLLAIVRALREQVDWDSLASRVDASPYARAFLTLVRELDIAPSGDPGSRGAPVRVHRLNSA